MGADVVSLAVALGGIVGLPENLEQLVVGDLGREKDHLDDFGVAGHPGADLLIGGIRRYAPGVSHRSGVNARELPETPLRSPETTHSEHRYLSAVGERRSQGRPQHVVGRRHLNRHIPSGEGLLGSR